MPFQLTVREPLANSSNNLYSAEPPIGSIIAWHPRLFSGAANTGIGTSDRIKLPANWCICDGRDLTANPMTKDSPLVDAGFNRVPDLTDNRFLMGGLSTSFLGDNYVYGGINHAGPPVSNDNNGDNSITISTGSLPPHTHGSGSYSIDGTISGTTSATDTNHQHPLARAHGEDGTWDRNFSKRGDTHTAYSRSTDLQNPHGPVYHTHSVSGTTTGTLSGYSSDGGFSNLSVSVLPKYLISKFIMRVK